MNSKHSAFVVFWLVFAVKLLTPAMAREARPLTTGGLHEVEGPQQPSFLSASEFAVTNIPYDDNFQQQWDEEVSVTDLPSATAEDQQSASRSCAATKSNSLCDDCCPSCERACPCLYGQIEALFLWRESRLIDQAILVDPNTNITYLSASNLESGFNPGVRATVGARICGRRALEFTYFGLCPDDESSVVVNPGSGAFLIFPGNFAGNVFAGIDRLQADYSSRLNSLEANLPCCCGCCDADCGDCCDEWDCRQIRCQSYEWFAGFRYIRLGEDLDLIAQRTVAGEVEEGSYDVHTTNNLYGLQLGRRTRYTRGRYGWETTGKVGIFGNDARQRQSVTDFPDFPLRPTVSSTSSGVAFVGEANLTALYRLTQAWNLRAGYSLLWIEGLALAPDQLDFNFASATGGDRLRNGGAMILHGVNVGVEARW